MHGALSLAQRLYINEHDHQLLAWPTCCELLLVDSKSNRFLFSEWPASDDAARFRLDALLFELLSVERLEWSALAFALFDCRLGVFAGVFFAFAGVFDLAGDLLRALFGVFAAGVFDLAGDLLRDRDLEFDLAGDGLLSAIFTDFGVLLVDFAAGVRAGVRLRLVDFLAGVLVSSLPKLTSLIVRMLVVVVVDRKKFQNAMQNNVVSVRRREKSF